jgi:hypothetical protein
MIVKVYGDFCDIERFREAKNKANLFVLSSACCEWIPAPRFRGDKFTPAKAGAGMTKTNISVNRCESVSERMRFEKTKPIYTGPNWRKVLFERRLCKYIPSRKPGKQSQTKPMLGPYLIRSGY